MGFRRPLGASWAPGRLGHGLGKEKVRRRPSSAAVLGRSWGRLGALLAALWLVCGGFPPSRNPLLGGKIVTFGLIFGRLASGGQKETKMAPKPKEKQCVVPSRFFASDGLLRSQDGPKTAQESPKRGLRRPQGGPKSAQERSKRGPGGDVGGS